VASCHLMLQVKQKKYGKKKQSFHLFFPIDRLFSPTNYEYRTEFVSESGLTCSLYPDSLFTVRFVRWLYTLSSIWFSCTIEHIPWPTPVLAINWSNAISSNWLDHRFTCLMFGFLNRKYIYFTYKYCNKLIIMHVNIF
jgi:hypothetical protein